MARPLETHLGVEVSAHGDGTAIAHEWQALAARAVGTGYQSAGWCEAWFRHCTSANGRQASVVAVRRAGALVAVLPLEVGEIGLARIGRGPGGRHANFRTLLVDPDVALDWSRVLVQAGAAARLDAILLANQIAQTPWGPHPLLAHPASRPSTAYAARLALLPDPDATLAKVLGKGSRKKLNQKQRMLSQFGPVEARIAVTDEDCAALMDLFFREKGQRLAQLGVPDSFADPAIQAFLREVCRPDGAMLLHGLWCGARAVAMVGGVVQGGRYSGCINAHDLQPDIVHHSPGEILFAEVIRSAARRGLAVFDLGVGRGPLKDRFCEAEEPLFDTAVAVTTLGRAALAALSAADWMKTTLQQDERLARPARKVAALLGFSDLR